jgi:glycosyltransferase involved in cell wall biosynthesis
MKRWLPNWFKFPFWYIFKSPQRKEGFGTLIRDLLGLFQLVLVQTVPIKKSSRLSVCIGNFNRNQMILSYLLPSLNRLDNAKNIELVLVDFGSDDFLELQKILKNEWKGGLKIVQLQEPFTRARAINTAVLAATEEIVFICDADFSLPKKLIKYCHRYTYCGSVWFPIVFYLYKDKPAMFGKHNGEWLQWGGKGILAIKREKFLEMNGLDERFKSWGGEDEEFWIRCHRQGLVVIRNRCKKMLHHWHPSFNPKFRNL